MPQAPDTFFLELTVEQKILVLQKLQTMEPEGALIAQVFGDGIRVKILSKNDATAVWHAISGNKDKPRTTSRSAYLDDSEPFTG